MGKASRKKAQPKGSVLSSEAMPLSPGSPWAQPWIALLLLSLLGTLIYANTFSVPFHFDDEPNIVDNHQIRNLSNFLTLKGSRYVGYLSLALNYHFGRLNVFGYHLVNLLIHIINSFLTYFFVLLLLRIPQPPLTPHASPLTPYPSRLLNDSGIALAASLLFVAHPIQTQAVTYIVQRFTSLSTLFYLLAVVLYLKWRLAVPESRYRSLCYAGALVSTVLAMKTKEISFTLPLMLLLIEVVFFGSSTRKRWMALIPFLLALLIIPLSHTGTIGEAEVGFAKNTTEISRLDYLFTQFNVIMTYLRLLILPVHQNLDYDYPIASSLLEPKVLFSFLFLLVLLTFSLYLLVIRPRAADSSRFSVVSSRLVGFGILWFFLTLSVESSIIPIKDVIFEHRLYLPSVGFLLTGSGAILGLMQRWQGMSVIVIGVLVVLSSFATYQRNFIWKDELTLWTDVIQKSPNKARGHYNLGLAHHDLGRLDEAVREFKTALALKADDADAHINLGKVYKDLGRLEEAVLEYKAAITVNPNHADAHINLGVVYQNLGHLKEAIEEYQRALTLKPDDADAQNNLGLIYLEQGKLQEALKAFEEAVKLKPDNTDVLDNLGVVYQKLGYLNEAIHEYRTALTLKPDDADAHNNLGLVYLEQGKLPEALATFEETVKLKPDYIRAHNNLGLVYLEQGKLPEALATFEEAIKLNPDYAKAHNNLGDVYQKLGRLEEAIREYQIALKLKPDLVEAHYSFGQTYQRQGRIQEAIHEFEQALRLNSDYDPARQALSSLRR